MTADSHTTTVRSLAEKRRRVRLVERLATLHGREVGYAALFEMALLLAAHAAVSGAGLMPLAAGCGLDAADVSQLLSGADRLTLAKVERLAAALTEPARSELFGDLDAIEACRTVGALRKWIAERAVKLGIGARDEGRVAA